MSTIEPVPEAEGVAAIICVKASATIFWLSMICFRIAVDSWLLMSFDFMLVAVIARLSYELETADTFIILLSAGSKKS